MQELSWRQLGPLCVDRLVGAFGSPRHLLVIEKAGQLSALQLLRPLPLQAL